MTGLIVILLLVVLATAVATGARRWSLPAPRSSWSPGCSSG
ncbi:hypothetical protein MBT84_08975 [Streptomyces sp. MBT84]|nr:hypothetical protein [Streptomyces sp. MBT84]MBW8699724.1 hypothetical protein [Streptomyces sp. MBT84]